MKNWAFWQQYASVVVRLYHQNCDFSNNSGILVLTDFYLLCFKAEFGKSFLTSCWKVNLVLVLSTAEKLQNTKNKQQYFYSLNLRKPLKSSWCRETGLYERTQIHVHWPSGFEAFFAMGLINPLCIRCTPACLFTSHASDIRACDCFFNHQLTLDVGLTLSLCCFCILSTFFLFHMWMKI